MSEIILTKPRSHRLLGFQLLDLGGVCNMRVLLELLPQHGPDVARLGALLISTKPPTQQHNMGVAKAAAVSDAAKCHVRWRQCAARAGGSPCTAAASCGSLPRPSLAIPSCTTKRNQTQSPKILRRHSVSLCKVLALAHFAPRLWSNAVPAPERQVPRANRCIRPRPRRSRRSPHCLRRQKTLQAAAGRCNSGPGRLLHAGRVGAA